MAPRTIQGTPEQWAVVGRRVRERRLALGRKPTAPSNKVWSGVENGKPENYRITEGTEKLMCEALDWEPGSIVAMLNGGEPTEITGRADKIAALTEEIADLRAVIEGLVRQLGLTGDEAGGPGATPGAGRNKR